MNIKDKEKILECGRKYYAEHKEDMDNRNRIWRENHKQERKIYHKRYRIKHREDIRIKVKRAYQMRKIRVLTHYSPGGIPRCACCGEQRPIFLTLDHINGDGAKHRKELRGSGRFIYSWIIENNFPLGFRVLCFNCNFAIAVLGYCPHQDSSSSSP